MSKIEELICKYDDITNIHHVIELIKFDCDKMMKQIISLEKDIIILKAKQRILFSDIAKIYIDFINLQSAYNAVCTEVSNGIATDNYLLIKNFVHIAKAYRIKKRNNRQNVQHIIDILTTLKKYEQFLCNIKQLIKKKDYINARDLLFSNLALYKQELYNLMPNANLENINLFSILNNDADKLIKVIIHHLDTNK